MSMIGEMYEEEIWDSNEKLKKKCEEFLAYLNYKMSLSDKGYFAYFNTADEFEKRFTKELKGNSK